MEKQLFDEDFFKSNELTESGKLEKAKRVWVPPSGKKKGYFRTDPRTKKQEDIKVGDSVKIKGASGKFQVSKVSGNKVTIKVPLGPGGGMGNRTLNANKVKKVKTRKEKISPIDNKKENKPKKIAVSGEIAYNIGDLLKKVHKINWRNVDFGEAMDAMDDPATMKYIKKDIQSSAGKKYSKQIKVKDISFSDTDSSNLSHAGIYFNIEVEGPEEGIRKVAGDDDQIIYAEEDQMINVSTGKSLEDESRESLKDAKKLVYDLDANRKKLTGIRSSALDAAIKNVESDKPNIEKLKKFISDVEANDRKKVIRKEAYAKVLDNL